MTLVIANLSSSYMRRQIYELEKASPKWTIHRVNTLERVLDLVCTILLEIGVFFSRQWEEASIELFTRSRTGIKIDINPSYVPVLPPAHVHSQDQTILNTALLTLNITTPAITPKPTTTETSPKPQPTITTAPTIKPSVPHDEWPFVILQSPDSSKVHYNVPKDNPQAMQFMLQNGWTLVEVKLPPKIDPFLLKAKEWRDLVLSHKTATTTHSITNENKAHQEILPGLFLGGNYHPSSTYNLGKELVPAVSYDALISLVNPSELSAPKQYFLSADSSGSTSQGIFTVDTVIKSILLIDETLREGKSVIVHCGQGQSRSPSLVAMYIAIRTGVSLDDAVQYLRTKRLSANPSQQYIKKMVALREEVEAQLKKEDSPFKLTDLTTLVQ